MKTIKLRELLVYIIGSIIVVAIINLLFQTDNTIAQTLWRALFMGVVLGSLFYLLDNRKHKKEN
jgi:uncharacterized membrane protein